MDELWTTLRDNAAWLGGVAIVLVAATLGQLLRTFVLDRLVIVLERKTASTLDEDIIRSLRRPVVLWVTLGGFYVALLVVDVGADMQELIGDILAAAFIISITLWFAEVVVRFGSGPAVRRAAAPVPRGSRIGEQSVQRRAREFERHLAAWNQCEAEEVLLVALDVLSPIS